MEIMCRLWTNFAKFGNPTPESDSLIDFQWKPVGSGGDGAEFKYNFLDITNDFIRMDQKPDGKRRQFWLRQYSRFNGGFENAML